MMGGPKTVDKTKEVFMLWVELEAVDAVLDAMEKAIENKVSTVVVTAIDVMTQALSEFGAEVVPPQRILKMLPELLEHQDQNVRACSMELTSDLCRWIGKDSVKSILLLEIRNKMLEKKLDAWLANVSGTRKPYCQTRSEQDKEPEQEAVYETVLAFLKNLEL
ncbi:protein MOR1-like isoform X2 [Lotus japonicus]|nr:protein MOR1-like isoform X2 [Lotus japonicus]XP_057434837.1 protein MOR1-like isoform X2 [Lotus japonicus]